MGLFGFRSEQVTGNGAEVVNGGGSVHDQKNPANAAVGEMSSAAPAHEEIGDWNAEVEKEEARRKELVNCDWCLRVFSQSGDRVSSINNANFQLQIEFFSIYKNVIIQI